MPPPPPPVCDAGRPATAPSLMPGVWTVINPPGQPFAGDPGAGTFLQGVTIDPCNPYTIYACLNNFDATKGGLWRSTDAGANWTQIGNLDQPLNVRVDPRDPRHLYAGDGVRGKTQGFWISHDGGNTWNKSAGWLALGKTMFIEDVYHVEVDPADFNHVLVSHHYYWNVPSLGMNSGVLESKDGGETWIPHNPQPTWKTGHGVWMLKNSTTWLLGTQDNGFWRTTDSGANWTQVTTVNMAHGGGQIYITKAGVIYASSAEEVLRSTDDGATWSKVGTVKFTTSVFGDGTKLYTHAAYGGTGTPFYTSPETDGSTWTAGTQMFTNGPFELALDSMNRIFYSGNWGNGVLALKL